MEIKLIQTGSGAYEQMKQLRVTVLLQPIGIPSSYIQEEQESSQLLIGAFEGQDMVGCCVLTPKESGTIQLRQMAVATSRQGKGIGASILKFAEGEARKRKFVRLMMHARATVCPFYQQCGYKKTGPEFYEVGIPHFVMEKTL